LYAFQLLPVNYAGLGLILLGIAFFVAELFVTSYGALGFGGVIAFVLGSVMLIETDVPGYALPWSLIGGVAAVTAAFFLVVIGMAVKARGLPVVTGKEELVGARGEITEQVNGQWWARVLSEIWKVRSQAQLRPGQRIRVVRMDGLVLEVEPDDN
jgi:membrane-bound serine protease (ClpP class)